MNKIKNIGIAFTVLMTMFSVTPFASAANNDNFVPTLTVGKWTSISCTATVTMGSIAGTGQSALATNISTCTVKTNSVAGYDLAWKSSGTGTLTDGTNTIAKYVESALGTPEVWSVASADSEWGGHLGSTSDTKDTATWGAADTYAGGKWKGIAITDTTIVSRTSETTWAGDSEYIYFGAEVGSGHAQPSSSGYTNTVTLTSTVK